MSDAVASHLSAPPRACSRTTKSPAKSGSLWEWSCRPVSLGGWVGLFPSSKIIPLSIVHGLFVCDLLCVKDEHVAFFSGYSLCMVCALLSTYLAFAFLPCLSVLVHDFRSSTSGGREGWRGGGVLIDCVAFNYFSSSSFLPYPIPGRSTLAAGLFSSCTVIFP